MVGHVDRMAEPQNRSTADVLRSPYESKALSQDPINRYLEVQDRIRGLRRYEPEKGDLAFESPFTKLLRALGGNPTWFQRDMGPLFNYEAWWGSLMSPEQRAWRDDYNAREHERDLEGSRYSRVGELSDRAMASRIPVRGRMNVPFPGQPGGVPFFLRRDAGDRSPWFGGTIQE